MPFLLRWKQCLGGFLFLDGGLNVFRKKQCCRYCFITSRTISLTCLLCSYYKPFGQSQILCFSQTKSCQNALKFLVWTQYVKTDRSHSACVSLSTLFCFAMACINVCCVIERYTALFFFPPYKPQREPHYSTDVLIYYIV